LLALTGIVLALALLLWAIVHVVLLPRVPAWKPWIEQRITAALGQSVSIGALELQSRGGAVVATLSDVRLLDAQGRTALAVSQIRAMPAWSSLWSLQPRMRQIFIQGLQLDIRRDAQGRLHVAGLDTSAAAGAAEASLEDDGRALDWLLAQHEIVLRGGVLRWTDELMRAPSLSLTDVDVVVRNGLLRQQWRLDASPPAEWGDRFTLMGHFSRPLLNQRQQWASWSGTAYALFPRADARQLGQHVTLPFALNQGRAAVRAWLDVQRGRLTGLTADVVLADVNVRLSAAVQPLELAQLQGRWRVARPTDAVEVAVKGLQARTGDGLEWPAGDLTLSWQQAAVVQGPPSPVSAGQLTADRLDLSVLASLANRLPLGAPLQSALASLSPTGQLSGLALSWRGAPDAPTYYEARAKVSQLSLASRHHDRPGWMGRPGLTGADIDVELNSDGGRAKLSMRQGSLSFPGVFEEAEVAVDELQAGVQWQLRPRPQGPPAVELRVSQARLANADAVTTFDANWRTGEGEGTGPGAYLPGVIDLQGDIVSGKADRVAAYLPLSLSPEVRRWVARAVRGGRIERGSFAVKGDIWQIPFAQPSDPGVFRIAARLSDAQFDYLPSVPPGGPEPAWVSPWPGFTQVSGDLLFERSTLQLDNLQGRLWDVQLRGVRARIDNLQQPMLRVQGDGRGPVADLLRFVDVSPVGQWLGGGLKPLSSSGQGDLTLDMTIPLMQPDRSTVRGSIVLPGNDIRVRADTPELVGARGRVDFSEQGFQVVGASARALGGELQFDGGSQPDGSLRFQAQGTATAEGLRRESTLSPLPWVAQRLRGQTAWKAQLGIRQGRPELIVTTDLTGMASDWPAPLRKPESLAMPARWQNSVADGGRDQLRLDVGTVVQLRLLREWISDDQPVRLVAGSLGLHEPAPALAADGPFAVRARLDRLDVDAWRMALQSGAVGGGGAPVTATPAVAGATSALPAMPVAGMPPWLIQADVAELSLAGLRVRDARLQVREETAAQPRRWAWDLQSAQMQGRGHWRVPSSAGDSGQLTVRLDKLQLPLAAAADAAAAAVAPTPGSAGAPAGAALGADRAATPRWPALDLRIDTLALRGRNVGSVALQAAPGTAVSGQPGDAIWRIAPLELRMPGATLRANGQWTPPAAPGAAATASAGLVSLDIDLELQDSARLAAHWGWNDALRGGNGRLSGKVSWPGEPWAMELATLDGRLNLALSQGQFLKAEPGIGRLLGILSLQSLPRRLLLDFRDIFQQGFAFDDVRGDILLSRGRATTDELRMTGVQATVLIGGSADLVKETQDLRVLIVPEVNAGAASLAYLAVNPAVGLGTFLAQLVLRDPLRAAGSREFLVTGSMADPKVERVERAGGAPQALPTPPPPASGPASAVPAPSTTPR
jgi:uncharacterized protein (TIGR02099 family)